MGQVKVSIIVAVYNTEKYLDRCLTSLVNQTLNEIEIICVNDASTDSSLRILHEWGKRDKRIKILSYSKNMRQGYARNIAIREAKGEYLGIVDSDDFVDEKMYETLVNNTDGLTVDLVVSNKYYVYKDGIVDRVKEFIPKLSNIQKIKEHAIAFGATMWTNIIKRSFFIENNLFYPEKLLYEDNANGPIIFMKAKSINIVDDSFYYYCMNPQSTIHQRDNKAFFDRTTTAKLFYERAKREREYLEFKEEIDYNFYSVFLYNTVTGSFTAFKRFPYHNIKEIANEYRSLNGLSIYNNKYFEKQNKNVVYRIVSFSCLYDYLSFLLLARFLLKIKKYLNS